jgi:cobalt-zinc-cadmium resistance protein CzcA
MDLASFVANAQEAVESHIKLPAGYTLRWGGQFENLREAYGRLVVAVPFALGLIFVLLYMAFGSLKPALLIYLNVPFAAVGGVFLLAMRQMHFSISAAIGFIALFGISVLNGVVLIATVNKLKNAGKPAFQAAFEGAKSRLRPVVMTASVAALGFLPMALSTNAGAEVQRPLETVVIGGLVSATFLTLFVLPTLYAFIYRKTPPPPDNEEVTSVTTPSQTAAAEG